MLEARPRRDDEGEHEALGLQRWGGDGAVRLLSADLHRRALLLERLHATDLDLLPVLEACEVVADLYARIHVPARPPLRSVTSYLDRWTASGGRCRETRRSRVGWSSRPSRSVASCSPNPRRARGECCSTATCTFRTCWPETVSSGS